ncbi:MAG: TonB-dependent receptor [Pseudarcicella sp.]|nr:TonB-dependent receptor [Pseudarcicella sp.]MBP6410193.1 TonB-dependent receptor [Pseudarcicella sp.]
MKIFKNLLFVLLLCSLQTVLAQKTSLSGYIKDATNGEKLIGASVQLLHNKQGVVSNNYGYYSLNISGSAEQSVVFSYMGYLSKIVKLEDITGNALDIELAPQMTQLAEVKVGAQYQTIKDQGQLSIPIKQLKAAPAVLGEPDIIRALTFTPGITAGTEGNTGLIVRGGGQDQNLILLDEAPIYNAGHLGGLFSVFNPNAIKSMEVFKSSFPARYGGKLSSVLDISMKEGNNKRFESDFTLGLVNSNFTLQGPLVKNKASFLVAARYSNLGWLTGIMSKANQDSDGERSAGYQFYDINAKVNYQLSANTQAFVSFFKGKDAIQSQNVNYYEESRYDNNWGNTTLTARLSHVFKPSVFGKFALIYSKYQNVQDLNYTLTKDKNKNEQYYQSEIAVTDITAKLRLDILSSSKNTIVTGLDFIHHRFTPGIVSSNLNSLQGELHSDKINTLEIAPYIENQYQISPRLKCNIGARWVSYIAPKKTFNRLEPRLNLDYDMGKSWSFKAGASQMNQFVHQLTSQIQDLNNDIWIPANEKYAPNKSTIFSAGFYKNFPKKGLEFSAELYSKTMSNLLDFKDGTNFIDMSFTEWDKVIVQNGKGKAYGLELYLAKNTGKLTGWLSYAYSKSERTFQNINQGKTFVSTFDRPHYLNVVMAYKLSSKWSVNTAWTLQSGHAATLPIAAYNNNEYQAQYIYSDRNAQRLPMYHRLDLSFSKNIIIHKNNKTRERTLTLGLYNSYFRMNANAVFYTQKFSYSENEPKQTVAQKITLFPILPSISYRWKF